MRYKISQYAKKYRVTTRTIWNWISDGRLKVERTDTGRKFIIDGEEKQINDAVGIYA